MDIKDVAQMARAIMLEHGSHSPIVLVEGTDGGFTGLLEGFPDDHQGKVQHMGKAGYLFGQRQGRIGRLRQAFFVCEGWMSAVKDGRIPDTPPSRDPNRREVLLVTGIKAEKGEQDFAALEVRRDGDGKVDELTEIDLGLKGTVESDLLPAFVAGFEAGSHGGAQC